MERTCSRSADARTLGRRQTARRAHGVWLRPTDLSAGYDANQPLKYFFIIDTRNYAEGTGKIHAASIIDYVQNAKGVETPFFADGQTVDIQNKGKRTIISVVVQGRGVNAPQNLSQTEDKLMWQAPVKSSSVLTGYKVYKNGELVATLAPDVLSYDLNAEETGVCTYSVSAIYGEKESTKVNLVQTVGKTAQKNVNFKKSGLRIPGVFGNTYQKGHHRVLDELQQPVRLEPVGRTGLG